MNTISTHGIATPARDVIAGQHEEADRYEAIRQYSLPQILKIWAAATGPMAILAWLVAPWLGDRIGGSEPLVKALLICFNAGLIWMLLLTLILVRRDALWLRAPQDVKKRRVGGKLWWWVLPFAVLSAGINSLPIDPLGPMPRDLPQFIGTDRASHFFQGSWGWFALTAMVALLAPLAEEVFFRGLLLPRMRAVFGKGDWIANGAIFTVYHLHQPWSMPATLIDGIFAQAYPAKRFRSIWIGIVSHTLPSFVIIGVLLSLVLK